MTKSRWSAYPEAPSRGGADGKLAHIAYEGTVYDVSTLRLWKGGAHMKHRAGEDMTEAIKKAPHGSEKLEAATKAGTFDSSSKPALTGAQKAFYGIAYVNLGLVFLVLLVIAFWRWGI